MATLAEQWDTVDEAPVRPVTQRPQPAAVNNNAANQQSFQQQTNIIPSLQARINGTDPVDAEKAKAELAALYAKMNGPALTQQPTEEKSLPPVTVTAGSTATLADLWDSPETAVDKNAPAVLPMKPSATEMASSQEPVQDTLKGIASVLDNTIGGVIPYTAQQAAQLIGRVVTLDPKEAAEWGSRLASILDKPFGKALGITDDPAYKNEATRRLFEFVGENASKGAEWIAKNTGGVIPKEDAEWMINMALPKVIEVGGGLIKKGTKAVQERMSSEMGPSINVEIQGVNTGRVEPTLATETIQPAARPAETVAPMAEQPTQKTSLQNLEDAYLNSYKQFEEVNKQHDLARASNDPNAIELAGKEWRVSYDALKKAEAELEAAQQAAATVSEQAITPEQSAAVAPEAVQPPVTEPVVTEAAQPVTPEPVVPATAAEQLQTQLESKKAEEVVQPVDQLQEQLKTKQQQQAEPLGSAKQRGADEPFAPVEYAESGVSRAEQKNRAATLQRLGFDEVRENVIEGHGKDRATDYQTSKSDTPMGNFLKDEFDKEKKVVDKFAQNLVKETGGTFGLDESSVFSRGNTILEPLKKLEENYDKRIREIYKERDALAKEIPVVAKNINDVLKDDSLTIINEESGGLAKGVEARMRQLEMMDKDGNLLPTDAHRAELLRQYLNKHWDRKNAALNQAIKEAIDEDVIANLDTNSSLYKEARNLVTERKNTLDNPKGISNILDASGPKEINRKVDVEKIPNSVAGMSVEQLSHVVDTLKNVPTELKPLADKALSEIKAQFANRAYEAMGKGANKLTIFLDANREKMTRLFSPEEIAKFRDLHNGMHILKTDTGYPGSKIQTINVEQKLGTKVLNQVVSKGAAVGAEALTGGSTMGVAGTLANEFVRKKQEQGQLKEIEKAQKEQFEKEKARYHKLSDLLED
jgi:hypothetical protein